MNNPQLHPPSTSTKTHQTAFLNLGVFWYITQRSMAIGFWNMYWAMYLLFHQEYWSPLSWHAWRQCYDRHQIWFVVNPTTQQLKANCPHFHPLQVYHTTTRTPTAPIESAGHKQSPWDMTGCRYKASRTCHLCSGSVVKFPLIRDYKSLTPITTCTFHPWRDESSK